MNTMKRASLLILALSILLTVFPATAYAANIAPFWLNTGSVTTTITFSSGTATCTSLITANAGTTSITATYRLQRKNSNGSFTTIKTWSNLKATDRLLTFSGTHSVSAGYTYRLTCDAVVVKAGVSESIYVESSEKTY